MTKTELEFPVLFYCYSIFAMVSEKLYFVTKQTMTLLIISKTNFP